jgi:hypothetical protein
MEVGLGGQSQASSRRPQAIKINETWANNEGLFVKAKLQNKCLAFLNISNKYIMLIKFLS